MYLMYDDEGNFMGVLNEHLEHNLLKDDEGYFFVSIPEQLEFDEEKEIWRVPLDELNIINH